MRVCVCVCKHVCLECALLWGRGPAGGLRVTTCVQRRVGAGGGRCGWMQEAVCVTAGDEAGAETVGETL